MLTHVCQVRDMEDPRCFQLHITLSNICDPQCNDMLSVENGLAFFRPLLRRNRNSLNVFRAAVKLDNCPLILNNMDWLDCDYGTNPAVVLSDTLIYSKNQRHHTYDPDDPLVQLMARLYENQAVDETELLTQGWSDEGLKFYTCRTMTENRVVGALTNAWIHWQNKRERGWLTQDEFLDNEQDERWSITLHTTQGLWYFWKSNHLVNDVFEFPCLAAKLRPLALWCVLLHRNNSWRLYVERSNRHYVKARFHDVSDAPFCHDWIVVGQIVMSYADQNRWRAGGAKNPERWSEFVFNDPYSIRWINVVEDGPKGIMQKRSVLLDLLPDSWEPEQMQVCRSMKELRQLHRESEHGLLVERGLERRRFYTTGTEMPTYDTINTQFLNWTKPRLMPNAGRVLFGRMNAKSRKLIAYQVEVNGKAVYARTSWMSSEYNSMMGKLCNTEQLGGKTVSLIVNQDVVKPKWYAIDTEPGVPHNFAHVADMMKEGPNAATDFLLAINTKDDLDDEEDELIT